MGESKFFKKQVYLIFFAVEINELGESTQMSSTVIRELKSNGIFVSFFTTRKKKVPKKILGVSFGL